MRKHGSISLFLVLAYALAVTPSLISQAQAPAQNRLEVRLKATLPDYKGPSRFLGRKALMIFSPDGSLVAMTGIKGTITVWETETGRLKATLKNGTDPISGFAFSPDGRLAATRNYRDKSVTLWEVSTWEQKATLAGRKRNLETKLKSGMSFEEEFGPVPFSPDGKAVLSEREDDLVATWEVGSGQQRFELNHNTTDSAAREILKGILFPRSSTQHYLILQTGFSSDGRWIFTINGDKSAKVWDAATGQLKTDIKNNERIYRAGFTPDNRSLLTVEQEGGMKLWDAETGELKGQVAPKGHLENWMKGFEFSPDGRYIATFFLGDTRLWDAKTAESKFKLPKSETTDATFSPDGRWLATASSEKQSGGKIWNVETGEVKITLPSVGEKTVSVTFSPDGAMLATSNDKGVYLWDVATGELLATLNDARYPVAFSPDGRTLATGARKDTALLWEIPGRPSR